MNHTILSNEGAGVENNHISPCLHPPLRPSLQHDEHAAIGTLSLLLNVGIIAAVCVAIYIGYSYISDADFTFDVGGNFIDGLISGVAGGVSALFTGDKGIFTSLRTIRDKSKINPFNWF